VREREGGGERVYLCGWVWELVVGVSLAMVRVSLSGSLREIETEREGERLYVCKDRWVLLCAVFLPIMTVSLFLCARGGGRGGREREVKERVCVRENESASDGGVSLVMANGLSFINLNCIVALCGVQVMARAGSNDTLSLHLYIHQCVYMHVPMFVYICV